MVIRKNLYNQAKLIFNKLNYLIPTISLVDEFYIKNHYNLLETIIDKKKQYSSVEEYCLFYENAICKEEIAYPDMWKKAWIFSDLQYWSEY